MPFDFEKTEKRCLELTAAIEALRLKIDSLQADLLANPDLRTQELWRLQTEQHLLVQARNWTPPMKKKKKSKKETNAF